MVIRIGTVRSGWDYGGYRELPVYDVSDGVEIGVCYREGGMSEWGLDANLEAILWENACAGEVHANALKKALHWAFEECGHEVVV